MAETWLVEPGIMRLMPHRPIERWIAAQQRRRCGWCGRETVAFPDPDKNGRGTIEHIIPQTRGGLTVPLNLKSACRRCNNGRQHCGECIGVLACAIAVLGDNASQKKIGRWWALIRREREQA